MKMAAWPDMEEGGTVSSSKHSTLRRMLFSTNRDVGNTSHSSQPEWLVGTQAPAPLPSSTGSLQQASEKEKLCGISHRTT